MSIKVRYFASLKESVGRGSDELPVTGTETVLHIWRRLNPDLAMPANMLAAVNMEYVALDSLVADGDELAFFPPVTGG
ncbi:MAG: MoaD/ThiS family protein [Methylomonas sp.]|jgi:molybdopterin synthase sulfur carrier subunit